MVAAVETSFLITVIIYREFGKVINALFHRNKCSTVLKRIMHGDCLVTNGRDIANAISDYFASVSAKCPAAAVQHQRKNTCAAIFLTLYRRQ